MGPKRRKIAGKGGVAAERYGGHRVDDDDDDDVDDLEGSRAVGGESDDGSEHVAANDDMLDGSSEDDGDDDDDDDGDSEEGEKSERDEVRLSIAREFLKQLGVNEGTTESEIAERLRVDAEAAAKRVHYRIADSIEVGSTVSFHRGHKSTPTSVAIHPTAKKAFTGGKDCCVIEWDIETGSKNVFAGKRRDFTSTGHFDQVLDICTNAEGTLVCSVGVDRLLRIWDIRLPTTSGKPVAAIRGHTAKITGVCCDPTDSNLSEIYTCSADKSLRTWNLGSRKEVDSFYGHTRSATCIDIAASTRPVTGGEDNTVRLWKCHRGTHLLLDKHKSPVDAVTAITGLHVFSGDQAGELALWSAASRQPLCVVPNAHGGRSISALSSIKFSDVIFSGSDNGELKIWRTDGASVVDNLDETNKKNARKPKIKAMKSVPVEGFVNGLAVSKKGDFLVAAVGQEERHGRWTCHKRAKNGILVLPLKHAASFD